MSESKAISKNIKRNNYKELDFENMVTGKQKVNMDNVSQPDFPHPPPTPTPVKSSKLFQNRYLFSNHVQEWIVIVGGTVIALGLLKVGLNCGIFLRITFQYLAGVH